MKRATGIRALSQQISFFIRYWLAIDCRLPIPSFESFSIRIGKVAWADSALNCCAKRPSRFQIAAPAVRNQRSVSPDQQGNGFDCGRSFLMGGDRIWGRRMNFRFMGFMCLIFRWTKHEVTNIQFRELQRLRVSNSCWKKAWLGKLKKQLPPERQSLRTACWFLHHWFLSQPKSPFL
jgi:hypothetical protein